MFLCAQRTLNSCVALRSLSLAVSAYSPTPGRHDSRWRSKSFALQPCWSTAAVAVAAAAADHKTGGKIFNYYSKSITVCVCAPWSPSPSFVCTHILTINRFRTEWPLQGCANTTSAIYYAALDVYAISHRRGGVAASAGIQNILSASGEEASGTYANYAVRWHSDTCPR